MTRKTIKAISSQKNQKEIFSALQLAGSVLLLACSVLLVGYYILFPSRGYFHSDTTDTIMWAEASYEQGNCLIKIFPMRVFCRSGRV
ncbi:MAG: hypothetical protein IKI37_07910 [Oscillospiraceae bacterium]|nr:hypothetical protein [Oscillospiraceae bacterium]